MARWSTVIIGLFLLIIGVVTIPWLGLGCFITPVGLLLIVVGLVQNNPEIIHHHHNPVVVVANEGNNSN